MLKQNLDQASWTVRAVGDLSEVPGSLRDTIVPARVPGCVHTDLMRAGKIEDPYQDLNEFKTRWIGHTDWQYRCTFDADPKLFDHERIDLACDGLDTIARIELNGTLVGETFNMHRRYRFDVRKLVKRGRNELAITFASPVKYAESMRRKLGSLPFVNGPAGPFNFIRKMACNFGWDWGPALPTSGIWKGIRLEGWSVARFNSVCVAVRSAGKDVASLDVSYALEFSRAGTQVDVANLLVEPGRDDLLLAEPTWHEDRGFRYERIRSDQEFVTRHIEYLLEKPALWWPRGFGDQAFHWLHLRIKPSGAPDSYNGEHAWRRHDRISVRTGVRRVELETSPDDIGRKFAIKLNGKPVFCKGFNWIPDDCFLDRACDVRPVATRIKQAIDAGANMLRVWGGGIYETDDFYEVCDELGVMVWQDFPFACAMYPEEEPFRSEVEAEARDNVARLSSHPSLTIWNGCNENLWGYRDWGWQEKVRGRTWGKGYYLDLLPKIVDELAPGIPYWAGSPWSGDTDVDHGIPPNAATHGNKHVWEAWFKQDYAVYRTMEPRFCSEFGFQAPATYASIASVVPPEQRDFGSLAMRHRQKSGNPQTDDGDRRNLRHLLEHFNLPGAEELLESLPLDKDHPPPPCGSAPLLPARALPSPVSFDDLHYLMQVNQARALTLGVEWFRSRQPTCMGTLYWQLNDCWPGSTSWSCVDGNGNLKPLWYATRRFYADSLLTIQPESDGSLHLCVINDCDEPAAGRFLVTRRSFDGKVLAEQQIAADSPARSVRRYRLDGAISRPADPSRELIAVGEPSAATWFFDLDKQLNYPPPLFDAHLSAAGSESRLTIEARSLLRDICIFADRLDPSATVSDQLVTLLPGESFTFVIGSKRPLSSQQLTSPPVFRCVNPFGRPG